ncbi:MAG: alpha/beta fold hydrolase [Pyrinomonadaceae bacterium]
MPLALMLLLCIWPAHATQDSGQLMVKVGAHRLHMAVTGQGRATVILEAGFGGTTESWAQVQPAVASVARVVSYDRAGLGQSEQGLQPRTAEQIARELHTALATAKLAPPYVLVSHSAGGAYARVFAHMYPQEVTALILIVPPQEDFLVWLKAHQPEQYGMPADRLAKLPAGMRAEWEARDAVIAEMRAAWPLPSVPIILLTSTRDDQSLASELSPEALQVLLTARRKWLHRVPGARQISAQKSGHNIPGQEPELVIETIKQVLAEVEKRPTKKQ